MNTKFRILVIGIIAVITATGFSYAQESEEDASIILKPMRASQAGEVITRVGRGFSLHKPNYLLPLTWGNKDRYSEDADLVFQISGRQQLFNTGFHLAYTQKSFWRVLDEADSRPFRETNYNPEIFYRLGFQYHDSLYWGVDFGYEHESNGREEPRSRSWDRLYIFPFLEYKRLRADVKLWYRLPENDKEYPGDTSGDENPDIEDYYGYHQLKLQYEFSNRHMISLRSRLNFGTGRGAVQVDYSLPTYNENMFFCASLVRVWGEFN